MCTSSVCPTIKVDGEYKREILPRHAVVFNCVDNFCKSYNWLCSHDSILYSLWENKEKLLEIEVPQFQTKLFWHSFGTCIMANPLAKQSWFAWKNWLVVEPYPSEKYEFVSWAYYSQYMDKQKMFQTTNQKIIIVHGEIIIPQWLNQCVSPAFHQP